MEPVAENEASDGVFIPYLGGGNSNIFYFHILFGEDEPMMTFIHIFQMGWFNHQPAYLFFYCKLLGKPGYIFFL